MTDAAPRYYALALQTRCDAVNGLSHADTREAMRAAICRVDEQVKAAKSFVGPHLKLVVLPEYFMTGYPIGETIDGWANKAGIAAGGPEFQMLGKVAAGHGVYLAANAYECDDHFPGLYFQTSFLLNPSGDTILRYRRLISMFAPTPHDVWDRYLDIYGVDAVFPVADTEIGRLACCASEEILFPEICRAHALRGAEVILHSTSENASPELTPKDVAKRARAIENIVYVVSANSGGIYGTGMPSSSVDGMSKIVDHRGLVLTASASGESMVANAEIDLGALRAARRRPGMANYLARQRLDIAAAAYGGRDIYPANTLLTDTGDAVVPQRSHFVETQRRAIERLIDDELI
ncbi:MAG: nitrilase-related carbon-nitrogen hydrolase [Woeseiaceae bacterium]|nr:nitrilase-related carbon-nitrogen hydrolase [Woeseiaceae bacterium]